MWSRDGIGVWCDEGVARVMWGRVVMWDDERVGWERYIWYGGSL